MNESPDAIRADIESTRNELGRDVDALADKVTPSKIMHRQTNKMRGAMRSVKEKVMGAADDAGTSVTDAGSSMASGIGDAGHQVAAKAQGNPLAVGLIAFGAGLVLASLIPASEKEKHMAEGVKEGAQPLVDEVTDAVKTMGQDLKEPAQEAATAVGDRASEAASNVKEEATGAAHTVADSATEARDNISDSR
jgi:gas vesicle protein